MTHESADPIDLELTAIQAAVAADLPDYLADLERLVNIDCGSYTPDGVDEVGRWTASFLAGLGADIETRPDPDGGYGATVVATFHGTSGQPRVLLIGHMDTVFDPGTAAARPFRIGDGMAHGPGVTDMKSGLLAGLYAIKSILATRGALPFERLTFIANPDEEVGSPSSRGHIRAAAVDVDACLVLECARANGDIVSARKGILDTRLAIHGRAAHAGVEPEKGRSAILEAARVVRELHALNGRWPGVTVNVGKIAGGTRPNVVAERCDLEVDVRATTADGLRDAEAAIRDITRVTEVPDTTIDTNVLVSWLPMEKLERSGRLVEHAQDIAGRLGFAVADTSTGGASDANSTSGMGVPTLDGLGPIGGNDHSPAEYLDVGSIVPRTALLAGLLLAIARDPDVLGWRVDDPRFASTDPESVPSPAAPA
ncbi:MAG TPA: M20 family metallopeptidase [Candidatus Limnocylindrales bacterium]|jgi:glutamate carboxypeptidase|nr:M20 family metallopeptidase [Candidatus Limnocylindrales bacterium]